MFSETTMSCRTNIQSPQPKTQPLCTVKTIIIPCQNSFSNVGLCRYESTFFYNGNHNLMTEPNDLSEPHWNQPLFTVKAIIPCHNQDFYVEMCVLSHHRPLFKIEAVIVCQTTCIRRFQVVRYHNQPFYTVKINIICRNHIFNRDLLISCLII